MVEKTFCKVRDILSNNGDYIARVEFYLPKGEFLRDLKPCLFKQLEELNLDHIGAEFYFCVDGTINNPKVYIEKYVLSEEDIKRADKLFEELEELMETNNEHR